MSKDIETASLLITKDFNLEKDSLPVENSIDDLRNGLEKIIRYLLDKDFERLLLAMYRIDIAENKVKVILSTSEPDKISWELADLIIERELQKVETRRKYRST